jgi:hypothetical protein
MMLMTNSPNERTSCLRGFFVVVNKTSLLAGRGVHCLINNNNNSPVL